MWGRIRKHRVKTSFRSLPGDLRKHSNRNTVTACVDIPQPHMPPKRNGKTGAEYNQIASNTITVSSEYNALSTEQELALPTKLYEDGNKDFLQEALEYRAAVKLLDFCGIPREQLQTEKATLYKELAELNYEIRQLRKDIKMCEKIQNRVPAIEKTLKRVEPEPQKKRQHQRER